MWKKRIYVVHTPLQKQNIIMAFQYLDAINQVFIKQSVELLQELTGGLIETPNKYSIEDPNHMRLLFAAEQSDLCMASLFKTGRPFEFMILDNYNQPCCKVVRELNICACMCAFDCPCDCTHYYTELKDMMGQTLGFVADNFSPCCRKSFTVYDAQREPMLHIQSPFCVYQNCICSGDVVMPVTRISNGEEIATLNKVFGDLLKECCTVADTYRIDYFGSVDCTTKLLLIMAVLVLDIMLYDSHEEKKDDNPINIG